MEFFHGYFDKSDLNIEPEDDDNFYDLEESLGCYFVKVDSQLYKFWSSDLDLDSYGFCRVVPPTDKPQLMLYWYNGGAGIHEVAKIAIKDWLNEI